MTKHLELTRNVSNEDKMNISFNSSNYGEADSDSGDSLPDTANNKKRRTLIKDDGKNKRRRRRSEYDDEEDLLVFGYEAHIFRDDDLAGSLEKGQYLIKWKAVGEMMDR